MKKISKKEVLMLVKYVKKTYSVDGSDMYEHLNPSINKYFASEDVIDEILEYGIDIIEYDNAQYIIRINNGIYILKNYIY